MLHKFSKGFFCFYIFNNIQIKLVFKFFSTINNYKEYFFNWIFLKKNESLINNNLSSKRSFFKFSFIINNSKKMYQFFH